jgi:hypothetical protein
MRYPALLLVLALFLVGCGAGQFTVKQADNAFSENKNPVLISENNRISSRSAMGGRYIDEKGIYLNPFVERDKTTNQIVALGFTVINKTDYDTITGDIDQLGTLSEVIFRLHDGQLITLKVAATKDVQSGPVSYNPVGRYASYNKSEVGVAPISKSDYEKLIAGSAISFKIVGAKRSRVYEEKDISESFIANLTEFYKAINK